MKGATTTWGMLAALRYDRLGTTAVAAVLNRKDHHGRISVTSLDCLVAKMVPFLVLGGHCKLLLAAVVGGLQCHCLQGAVPDGCSMF